MCFSATASFTAAIVLIPAGVYCLKQAIQLDKPYWAFAMLPLIFGLQQLLEGGVWLALMQGEPSAAHMMALGFLMFSHVFWLGWIAYSSYLTESSPQLRRIFLVIVMTGVLFGVSMYIPLLFNPEWLLVSIVRHSIHYDLIFISDTYISQQMLTALYAGIILVPLMLSSDHYHSVLGVLILFSGLLTWAFFGWAFVSVWCYFAAIISLYIFMMIARSIQILHAPSIVLQDPKYRE